MKKSSKGSAIFRIILAITVILGALYIGKEAAPLIKLGLDLDGGVSITYQAVKPNPTRVEMDDAVYKLQLKAQDYSNEAEVYQEGSNRINIDIPGVSDANEILAELGKPGALYFVEGELDFPFKASVSEASRSEAIAARNKALGQNEPSSNPTETSANNTVQNLLGGNVNIDGAKVIQHPDGSITIGGEPGEGDVVLSDTTPQEGTGLQTSGDITPVDNTATPEEEVDLSKYYDLYDYDADPIFDESQVVIQGTDIVEAQGGMYNDDFNRTQYVVDLAFTEEGKQKFAAATERNLGRIIYIIYNGDVVSFPTVQSVISDGRAQITGMESLETANLLASTIRIGALPLELEEQRSNVVGAKLGEEAVNTSLKAGIIGFIIVCLFMIFVYRIPGLAAALALCLYTGLMLFLVQSFEITLTLPGIAGIILSIGMAVDANVIIFTRIKEELGLGHHIKQAIEAGFHKALSAIMDGNITTLIAAAVLFIKGTGSIRGFAQTLALGIVLSLISALLITRFILKAFVDLGIENPALFGVKKAREPFNFVGFRKISYLISGACILVGIIFLFINNSSIGAPFNLGLDFKGGTSTSVKFNEELTLDDIDKKVVPIFESVTHDYDTQTQKVEGSNEVIVKTRTLSLDERTELYNKLMATVATGSDARGNELTAFGVSEDNITTENITGAVSNRMRQDAAIAVVIATILMLIYIWFRFKDIRFASSAVLALIHDCLITIGCYAIFKWTVDSTFIACMLTIVGYSINATIVIFDRIRENMNIHRGQPIDFIVNTSITETFTRSINTSLTTFIMVLVLFIMGVESIRMFALPLMIGILAGTWSSVTITGALWSDFKKLGKKKE